MAIIAAARSGRGPRARRAFSCSPGSSKPRGTVEALDRREGAVRRAVDRDGARRRGAAARRQHRGRRRVPDGRRARPRAASPPTSAPRRWRARRSARSRRARASTSSARCASATRWAGTWSPGHVDGVGASPRAASWATRSSSRSRAPAERAALRRRQGLDRRRRRQPDGQRRRRASASRRDAHPAHAGGDHLGDARSARRSTSRSTSSPSTSSASSRQWRHARRPDRGHAPPARRRLVRWRPETLRKHGFVR